MKVIEKNPVGYLIGLRRGYDTPHGCRLAATHYTHSGIDIYINGFHLRKSRYWNKRWEEDISFLVKVISHETFHNVISRDIGRKESRKMDRCKALGRGVADYFPI